MRAIFAAVFVALFVSSCHLPAAPIAVALPVVSEDFASQRFLLELRNETAEAICIFSYTWSNQWGEVDGGGRVFVEEFGGRFPSKEHIFECPGCLLRIAPGATLHGFIAFSEFDDPHLAAENPDRRLHYYPIGLVACNR